jgi:hypothetical protein
MAAQGALSPLQMATMVKSEKAWKLMGLSSGPARRDLMMLKNSVEFFKCVGSV